MIFEKPEVIGELNDAVCERFHKSLPFMHDNDGKAGFVASFSSEGTQISYGDTNDARVFLNEIYGLVDATPQLRQDVALLTVVARRVLLQPDWYTVIGAWHSDGTDHGKGEQVSISRGISTEFLHGCIEIEAVDTREIEDLLNSKPYAETAEACVYAPLDNQAVLFDKTHFHRSATNKNPHPIDRLFVSLYLSEALRAG